jgi:transposase
MRIIRIGLDTSKHVFQVHGVDENDQPVLRRKLTRHELEIFFVKLPATRVGLEACGASHYWARVLQGLGHEVVLVPPQYVKPYVQRGKNDAKDAAAICEAMSRPGMRFVAAKSAEQQAGLMLLKTRELLVKQRTMLSNAIRGHAAEFGVIGAKGAVKLAELMQRALGEAAGLPELAREMLGVLFGQYQALDARLTEIERQLLAQHQQNPVSQCLATQPGIGPITAVTFALKITDPRGFKSCRHFAASLGLTPKEHSTAGRQRLGGISRQGDERLRQLLVLGATARIKAAKPSATKPSATKPSATKPSATKPSKAPQWLLDLIARRPKKVAAVALANKMARTLWAMMVTGELYREPTPQAA